MIDERFPKALVMTLIELFKASRFVNGRKWIRFYTVY